MSAYSVLCDEDQGWENAGIYDNSPCRWRLLAFGVLTGKPDRKSRISLAQGLEIKKNAFRNFHFF